ncbi:arylsulfatase family member K, partial [Homo sapiens]
RAAKAPNVVLVVSDSFDGRLTFHPGSQVVKLPFINFMKTRGTSFLNAYTNSPICCPSRAVIVWKRGQEMLLSYSDKKAGPWLILSVTGLKSE